jgi:N-acetylglutamate synthase-like GNAT family acetyltransferase
MAEDHSRTSTGVDRNAFEVTTDRTRMDIAGIHEFLSSSSHWALGTDITTVRRSMENSLSFAILDRDEKVVAFGRVISDKTTFAYITDVFVIESHRGRGLAGMLIEAMLAHPDLQGLRQWALKSRDASGLYQRYGFERLPESRLYMQRPGSLPPEYRREKE